MMQPVMDAEGSLFVTLGARRHRFLGAPGRSAPGGVTSEGLQVMGASGSVDGEWFLPSAPGASWVLVAGGSALATFMSHPGSGGDSELTGEIESHVWFTQVRPGDPCGGGPVVAGARLGSDRRVGGRESRRGEGELLDIRAEVLRCWVERAEIDAGGCAGVTSVEHSEIVWLKNQNAQLRRANEILETASAFSRQYSSTADFRDRRVHRRPQGPLRRRADLSHAHRTRDSDRPEHLLRAPVPAGVWAGVGRRPSGEQGGGLVAREPAGVGDRRTGHRDAPGRAGCRL